MPLPPIMLALVVLLRADRAAHVVAQKVLGDRASRPNQDQKVRNQTEGETK